MISILSESFSVVCHRLCTVFGDCSTRAGEGCVVFSDWMKWAKEGSHTTRWHCRVQPCAGWLLAGSAHSWYRRFEKVLICVSLLKDDFKVVSFVVDFPLSIVSCPRPAFGEGIRHSSLLCSCLHKYFAPLAFKIFLCCGHLGSEQQVEIFLSPTQYFKIK